VCWIALIGRKSESLRGSEESEDGGGLEGVHVCEVDLVVRRFGRGLCEKIEVYS
jgi:hypothetical protein